MKKLIFTLVLLFSVSCSLSLISCGGDDDPIEQDDNTGNDDNNSSSGNNDDVSSSDFSPTAQKQKLESAAMEFMQEYPTDNFEEFSTLVKYLSEEYNSDNYDTENIEEWFDDCLASISQFNYSENEEIDWGSACYNYYTRVFAASNFKGSFEAKNGKWKYSNAEHLQFIIKDENMNECVLKLTTSGSTKKVYVSDSEDYYWDYEYIDGAYIYYNTIDISENYIMVPENLTITLTRAGKTVACMQISTDLSSMAGEDFDLSRDKYSVKASLDIEDYTFAFDQIKYAPEKGSAISYVMKHNNKQLFKFAIGADVDATNDDFYGCDNAELTVDILGQVQVKGTCSDIIKYCDIIDKAENNENDEDLFKDNITKANQLLNLGLYYDNRNKKYANVELKCFQEDEYYYGYYSYWTYYPVIIFDDGTSYAFDEFFNEDNFKKLIKAAKRLFEDYSDMLAN
ncbi:MAG: hypothetical protein IJN24_05440 [Bacteroidaceae bacterium]|nr:hypothetical protein [Bacteroidaceae bacterium]